MPSYIGDSGSFSHMKNLNLEKVYRTIVLHSPISRADISRLTGLNKVTVSNCIRDLLEKDIISEEGIVNAGNGRPPVMLKLSETFGIIIALEISGISTNIMISDLRGNILDKTIRDPKSYKPEELVKLIKSIVADCNKKFKTTNGVIGLGISLPVNYNQLRGEEPNSPLPQWKGVDAKKLFKKHFPKLNIEVISNAAAGTMGEIHFGSANPDTYLVYLHGNWHLKMDFYTGSETFSSRSNFSGKFGNTILKGGRENPNITRLDDVASMKSLVEALYPKTKKSRLDAVLDIHKRQKEGDEEVDKEIKKILDYLAISICNVCVVFKPDTICIGGYLGATLADGYVDILSDKVNDLLGNDGEVKVVCSEFGVFNVGFGCISWIRDNIVDYVFGE